MKNSHRPGLALAQALAMTTGLSVSRAPVLAAGLSADERPVIVIMKNKVTGEDAAADQKTLMDELRQVKAHHIKPFRLVNAFAATVSEDELARLKSHPEVESVIPDLVIRRSASAKVAAQGSASAPTPPLAPDASGGPSLHIIPGACGANGAAVLDPEALPATQTDSDDPSAPTARSLGLTGSGVKVAFLADGVDPQNINFLRADGTSAFADYQDFSGDGPNALTSGAEAFEDANMIAGQGLHIYDVSHFSAQPLSSPCNIRIEGVAPGAQLVGLKTFSQYNASTTSGFLQAIEYAVTVAHVDVINESFASFPLPDVTSLDIQKQFNDAAVRAGVTITAASGDDGPTNTLVSPGSDPLVISVGASTTFRFYAQTNFDATRYFATSGWLNDNASYFSSGGFNRIGQTLSLLAPGDLGFSSCDATPTFQGCTDLANRSSEIKESSGTSMAAPLTAGAAALVIQAYRLSHHGASPKPALIKQILLSTATDLGLPAVEQGAGILNTYKAVLLAQAVDGGSPVLAPKVSATQGGQALLLSRNSLSAVGREGSSRHWTVTVTNPSALEQTIHATGRTLGPDENIQNGTVKFSNASFVDFSGTGNNFGTFTFTVPEAADHLSLMFAFPASYTNNGSNPDPGLVLVDPLGRLAANGSTYDKHGRAEVRSPAPGTWTATIFSSVPAGGTVGAIPWQVATQRFVPFAKVSPSLFTLPPHGSRALDVEAVLPKSAGNSSGSIILTSSSGGMDPYIGKESNSIPVTLRTLVDVDKGGAFNGVLTGGIFSPSQTESYQFEIKEGHANVTANVSLTNDPGLVVGLYLLNPEGTTVGYGQSNGSSLSVSASAVAPAAGKWTLVVNFGTDLGDEVSQPYTGSIELDQPAASAPTLPRSPTTELSAGTPITIPVTVTNLQSAPFAIFMDARLDQVTKLPLATRGLPESPAEFALPTLGTTAFPTWLVPSETSAVDAEALANVPIEFDFGPVAGDPDLLGTPVAPSVGSMTYSATGSYAAKEGVVSAGTWTLAPDEIGPYGSSGMTTGAVSNVTMTATTKAFDPAITSPTGDFWFGATDVNYSKLAAVTVSPGQSVVIPVTLTPNGASGTVVTGTLYIDSTATAFAINSNTFTPQNAATANEVFALPYAYTIR